MICMSLGNKDYFIVIVIVIVTGLLCGEFTGHRNQETINIA